MGRRKKDYWEEQEEDWSKPSHPSLVDQVKKVQRTSEEGREAWTAHCQDERKDGTKDPAKHSYGSLQRFLERKQVPQRKDRKRRRRDEGGASQKVWIAGRQWTTKELWSHEGKVTRESKRRLEDQVERTQSDAPDRWL